MFQVVGTQMEHSPGGPGRRRAEGLSKSTPEKATLRRSPRPVGRPTVRKRVPHVSWATSAATRKTMQACRDGQTRPEVALRSALFRMGLRFRVVSRPFSGVRMTADVLFPRLRVAIFVDGCFWHGCPDHLVHARTNAVYWDMKISSNRARDRATDRMLQDRGWTSVRVWEHEDTNVAALRIASLVRQQSLAATPGMTAAR